MESIFQDVLDDPNLRITAKTTASDVPGWDSLSTINLVFALDASSRYGSRWAKSRNSGTSAKWQH